MVWDETCANCHASPLELAVQVTATEATVFCRSCAVVIEHTKCIDAPAGVRAAELIRRYTDSRIPSALKSCLDEAFAI